MDDEAKIVHIRTMQIEPNREQPRKYFDEDAIDTLAESIQKYGVLQPLLVEKADGYYRIIAGERRWRAAAKLKLPTVPVIIRNMTEQEIADVALIENLQREDLNPIEEAEAFQNYCLKFNATHEELAERVSSGRVTVTNLIRLLKLPAKVQDYIRTGQLSAGHGKALLSLRDEDSQIEMAEKIIKEGLTVRDAESLVKKKVKKKSTKKPIQDYSYLGTELSGVLGTKVTVNKKGKTGTLSIEFYDDDMLDSLYEFLTGYGH